MPRKKLSQSDAAAREQEILSKPVRMDGQGEDPAVRAMLSREFTDGTNTDALNIALAMQQLLKGQNSLLENDKKFADELNRIRARMDKIDEDAQRFENDRERWLEEITARADKFRMSDADKERTAAAAAIELSNKVQEARASMVMDRQMFDAALEREPKENVVSSGVVEVIMENGAPAAKLYPEEIRVKHRRWVLQPGVPTPLPQSIAQAFNNRRRSEAETAERQAALKANLESTALAQRMKEIDEKYNSSTARLGEN